MTRFHPESGALFLHIPRTGGTSVQKFLSICGLDCVNWVNTKRESKKHAILHHIGPNRLVRVKFTFAFVRHPLTFYTSAWKWISGAGDRRAHIMDPIRWHPFQTVAGLYDPEFSVWASCD